MRAPRSFPNRGFTLIELLVTLALVSILVLGVAPLAEVAATRTKEQDLRRALRQIRTALDQYKLAADLGQIPKAPGESGYPHSLEQLAHPVGGSSPKEDGPVQLPLVFLREVPRDPFCNDPSIAAAQTWAPRSYLSTPEDPQPGDDVFDVHSRSAGVGLDGIPYSKW